MTHDGASDPHAILVRAKFFLELQRVDAAKNDLAWVLDNPIAEIREGPMAQVALTLMNAAKSLTKDEILKDFECR
jgi:hypothetical protein